MYKQSTDLRTLPVFDAAALQLIGKPSLNEVRNNVSARQRYRVYPLTHSQQHSLQCVILYGQSGRADGPSVWLRKTPSPHFQFSTLMNHNQIIHKLPPRFQTNNMAQKCVWLRVRVWLVRRQHVDELARSGIWSTRPWKLYYKMRPRCCQPLHWAVFMSFCFLVSGILWLGLLRFSHWLSREICGLKDFPYLSHI